MQTTSRHLIVVKLAHTVVWVFFVSCIVAIPVAAWGGRYRVAVAAFALVCVEVAVLALNGWKCPLTAIAARYTDDRAPNFDIYLPQWIARYNKEIFGPLFVLGSALAWGRWAGWIG
jgi:hypothetical protein